jgi:steroid 5-alpha reductase family enzyme
MVVGQIISFFFTGTQKTISFLTPDFFQIIYTSFVLNVLYFATWMISAKIKDTTLVNFMWGFGVAIQAIIYFFKSMNYTVFSFFSEKFSLEKLTFTILIAAHGLAISSYLIIREYGHSEDKRWSRLREKVGHHFWWLSYFIVFMPAVFINLLMGTMIYAFDNAPKSDINSLLYYLGISSMIFGGLFGVLADIQKYYFQSNKRNEGKLLEKGLWSITRHPNYFGNVVFWWGVYFVNFSAGILWTFSCPVIFTFLMLFVTGIPVNERLSQEEYGEQYKDYQNRVPVFIPNPFTASAPAKGEGEKLHNVKESKLENKMPFHIEPLPESKKVN